MNVHDVMTSPVITVRPETSLKEVARILAQCGISGVPVVVEDDRVVGIVSEGDILFKERGPSERKGAFAWLSAALGRDDRSKPEAQTAAQAMTAPAKTISPWFRSRLRLHGCSKNVSTAFRSSTRRTDWSAS